MEELEQTAPETVTLEHYSSANFIGLFIEETHADYMRRLTAQFATEALRKAGRSYRRYHGERVKGQV